MSNEEAFNWFQQNSGVEVKPRKMFGGLGVFSGDIMFALIYDGLFYLKSTKVACAKYVKDGFQFEAPFGRRSKMPYWNVPKELGKGKLREWSDEALEYARATKKKK